MESLDALGLGSGRGTGTAEVEVEETQATEPVHSQSQGEGALMAWIVLVVSGLFEAVWAIALGKSEGFSRLWPTLIFVGGLIVSMGGLAWAMKELPTGSSYAIWVSIGAAAAVVYGMATGDESFSMLKVLLLMGLIGCVVGLKLAS